MTFTDFYYLFSARQMSPSRSFDASVSLCALSPLCHRANRKCVSVHISGGQLRELTRMVTEAAKSHSMSSERQRKEHVEEKPKTKNGVQGVGGAWGRSKVRRVTSCPELHVRKNGGAILRAKQRTRRKMRSKESGK